MGSKAESGQVMIELAILALVFAGIFLLAISAGNIAGREQARSRFSMSARHTFSAPRGFK
jgi:hypothetical protein